MQDPGRPSKGIVQLVKDIMAEDGVGGFFKGWWAQIISLGSSNFVYFYASCMIKVMISTRYYTTPDCRHHGIRLTSNMLCPCAGKVVGRCGRG